jgi:hypothetical protein
MSLDERLDTPSHPFQKEKKRKSPRPGVRTDTAGKSEIPTTTTFSNTST